jgi:hypothetical protein
MKYLKKKYFCFVYRMLHFLLIDGLNNSANLEISQAFHKISRQLQDTIIYNLIKKNF